VPDTFEGITGDVSITGYQLYQGEGQWFYSQTIATAPGNNYTVNVDFYYTQ
jgi:hypothetical protein